MTLNWATTFNKVTQFGGNCQPKSTVLYSR